jgi:hypothetical protein
MTIRRSTMTTSARVIADSISPFGNRVTTMVVTLHRFVLAEFNTHRVFSRNSASSRAIPVSKMLERYYTEPAYPISWPAEKPGMQGGEELTGEDLAAAKDLFAYVNDMTYKAVEEYIFMHPEVRLHKSVMNRLLEPFLWHTIVVTSTEWDNFFDLRCHELAQPEIRAAAELMEDAWEKSTPVELALGMWHLPFFDPQYAEDVSFEFAMKASVARCAWVSTMSHDGEKTPEAIERMYDRLVNADPMHASPLEHQCTPSIVPSHQIGNLIGWDQLRHFIERGVQPW